MSGYTEEQVSLIIESLMYAHIPVIVGSIMISAFLSALFTVFLLRFQDWIKAKPHKKG